MDWGGGGGCCGVCDSAGRGWGFSGFELLFALLVVMLGWVVYGLGVSAEFWGFSVGGVAVAESPALLDLRRYGIPQVQQSNSQGLFPA